MCRESGVLSRSTTSVSLVKKIWTIVGMRIFDEPEKRLALLKPSSPLSNEVKGREAVSQRWDPRR